MKISMNFPQIFLAAVNAIRLHIISIKQHSPILFRQPPIQPELTSIQRLFFVLNFHCVKANFNEWKWAFIVFLSLYKELLIHNFAFSFIRSIQKTSNFLHNQFRTIGWLFFSNLLLYLFFFLFRDSIYWLKVHYFLF